MRLNVFRLYHNYWCLKQELSLCEASCIASPVPRKALWSLSRHVRGHCEPFAVLFRPAIGVAATSLLAIGRRIAGGGVDDGEITEHPDFDVMSRQIFDGHRRRRL